MSGGEDLFSPDEMFQMYVEEGHEHIQLLNSSLLLIEREGADETAVNDAFRAAHSIKGMAATMGFATTTTLTHELENALSRVRDEPALVTADTVSVLLRACDLICELFNEVEQLGAESADVSHCCVQLASITPGEAVASAADGDAAAERVDPVQAAIDNGIPVLCIDVRVNEASLMPGARLYASLLALDRVTEVLDCKPSREQLERGDHDGQQLTVWVVSNNDPDELTRIARTPEVERVDVAVFDPNAVPVTTNATAAVSAVAQTGSTASNVADSLKRARSVRVDASRLDDLMHGVGELLVRRARVKALAVALGDRELHDAVDALDRAAREVQAQVMDVRMVSVDAVMRMLPRLVRDLSGELGKQVRLTMSGRDTELDRTVIDVLADPLVHLVRNAIDHGIESPEDREAAGKPATGVLDVSASAHGGTVSIKVRDDGAGMQPDRIREVAVSRGVLSADAARALSDEDALDLCFAAGFSTRERVSLVSGRGVGLDVVRASVRALGGDVLVASSDEGTIMTIRLPLTLAIRPVLLVEVADESYALHTDRVGQTLELHQDDVQWVAGKPAFVYHGEMVPLVWLGEVLGVSTRPLPDTAPLGWADAIFDTVPDTPAVDIELGTSDDTTPRLLGARSLLAGHVVLLSGEAGTFGVVVDRVVGHSEVVTRPLPTAVQTSDALAACAVLGDGSIVFLIDGDMLRRGSDTAAA